jgi:hypothetical protein
VAAATVGSDAALLQIVKRFRSRFDGSQEIPFVLGAAKANDHSISSDQLRLSLSKGNHTIAYSGSRHCVSGHMCL